MNVPFKPEGEIQAPFSIDIQRNEIARAQEVVAERLKAFSSKVLRRFKSGPLIFVRVDPAGLADLARNPDVASIQEDIPVLATLGSAPLIGANDAWAMGYSGAGQNIAILDTGVDGGHELLTGKVASEACFSTVNSTRKCNFEGWDKR